MVIHKTADSFSLSRHLDRLCVNGGQANHFYFEDGRLTYIKYGVDQAAYQSFVHLDKTYVLQIQDKGSPWIFKDYQNELISLLDMRGEALALPIEYIFCIANNMNKEDNGIYVAVIDDYPVKDKRTIATYKSETNTFSSIERDIRFCMYWQEFFYALDRSVGAYVKIDHNHNNKWSYHPDFKCRRTSQAKLQNGFVFLFLGPKEEQMFVVDTRGAFTQSGGELVALNDADGSLIWKREFPNSVDEFHLVDDKLYVLSLNEVLVLDPGSGEEMGRIDTQTSVPFNRMMRPTIFLDQRYLYYTHYDDALILVYDRETLNLAKRIDMPEGYRVKRHDFHDTRTGKHYFGLHNLTQYGALWPILELDPNDLNAPVEFEPEPEMQIDFVPSQDGQPGRELAIRLRTESLDDALRFGEIYTRDHAQWHSYNYMGMSFAGRQPTPDFNGLIRFQYSGCNQPRDVVEEHLLVMEDRFKKWNAKEGFYSCIDKKQPVRLVAEYLDEN